LQRFRSRMLGFMGDFDVIVSPVSATPAPLHGGLRSPESVLAISYTQAYNLTGWPSLSVRCGWSETNGRQLPVGVQLIAMPSREDLVLRLGLELERTLGGFEPPDLSWVDASDGSSPIAP